MDISNIASLIETFNSSHDASTINEIQNVLQEYQKSDFGPHMADALLSMKEGSPNVKYFGALTYTVQLTTREQTEAELWPIFQGNLIHLTRFISLYVSNPSTHSNLLVTITKLMSNLSFIFLTVNQADSTDSSLPTWNNPVNTCIKLLQNCNDSNFAKWSLQNEEISTLLHSCLNAEVTFKELIDSIKASPSLNKVLLHFTRVLVEDLNKYQPRKTSMSHVYETVHHHLYISTMAIINFNLENLISSSNSTEIFTCITSWINYISMARNLSAHGNMDLTEMFNNMIRLMCLKNHGSVQFAYSVQVISIFDDVFSNDPTLMSFECRSQLEAIFLGVSRSSNQTISNDWMMSYMDYLVANEMYDELKDLASCVVDFLQISNLDVCNKLFTNLNTDSLNESLNQYVKVLLQLTNFPLVPILEEAFSSKMAEFWLDLAEGYTNLPQDTLRQNANELAETMFGQVVEIYLPKISLMNKQKIMESDGDDMSLVHEFDDFRGATQDLFEMLWSILGHSKLTMNLISGVGQADSSVLDLFHVEAMSFLLTKLLDGVNFSQSPFISDAIGENRLIENLLYLLQTGCKQQEQTKIAQVLKLDFVKATCGLLSEMSTYFCVDPKPLGPIIECLFECLETSRQYNMVEYAVKMEVQINRTISMICERCRIELIPFLPNFIHVLGSIMKPESPISYFTREKFVKSIGNIIQMCFNEGPETQGRHLLGMLEMIGNSMEKSSDRSDMLCLVTCLSELGSGLSQVEDDEEFMANNPLYLQQLPLFQNYWREDPLHIRQRVMHLIEFTMSKFGSDPEFVEVCCLIIGKAISLPDDLPHFLRYPLSDVLQFLLNCSQICELSSGLPFIEYQLEKIVSSFRNQMTSAEIDEIFEQFFIRNYESVISQDPDLIQSMISWVSSVLEAKPSLVLHSKAWNTFIIPEFIKFLTAKEKFTINAVTKFWIKTLNNRKFTQDDIANINAVFESIGKQLVFQTIYSLFNAQRSDVPQYAELIRTLIAKYPIPTKTILESVLPEITQKPLTVHERFISKLMVTRGSRASSNVVLEWWLDTNGLPSLTR